MKKFIFILSFLLIFCLSFSACSTTPSLNANVSELRSDVFSGKSENFTLKAGYGFKEEPFINDGTVGETVSTLSFRLSEGQKDGVNYSLSFIYNGQTYKTDFKLNPIRHSLIASVEIDDFDLKEFTVTITASGKAETIVMRSSLPDGTITSSEALKHLNQNQAELISAFSDEQGNFNAELYLRVIVKDEKPFWYVGIASGNDNLKALLVDGFTGEVLAIREIF